MVLGILLLAFHQTAAAHAPAACARAERREALRAMQEAVFRVAPREVASLKRAIQPGGSLAGWRLSHGYVVLAGAGAVAVDNLDAVEPMPPLLLYAPSASSTPSDWLDFDREDAPYRLVGWGYIAPYSPGSQPPARPCIAAGEWFVHEAGWHLKDGSMLLSPGASVEPKPPPLLTGIHMWHPRVWDIHVWAGGDGVASIAYSNPKARAGVALPEGTFFRIAEGREMPMPNPKSANRD